MTSVACVNVRAMGVYFALSPTFALPENATFTNER